MDEDYPAGPEITEPLPERSNWRGSESSTLENDVYVWRYTLIVVHARNEWMNECCLWQINNDDADDDYPTINYKRHIQETIVVIIILLLFHCDGNKETNQCWRFGRGCFWVVKWQVSKQNNLEQSKVDKNRIMNDN